MPIFNKIYKLSKKLSSAILENKSLHDVETPVDWSEDVKKQVLDGLSDHEIKANLELLDNIDTKSGWEQIERRITGDKPKHHKRLSISSFYKVAALIVLFIS